MTRPDRASIGLVVAVAGLGAALLLTGWLVRPRPVGVPRGGRVPDLVVVAAPVVAAPSRTVADPTWVRRRAAATGLPDPAVRAYADAALALATAQPSCHLGWNTLAGLGEVESLHGTIGGRVLQPDGRPDRPVLGPALDGRGDLGAVRSADGGWERARGPLQFLPATWARWGADGDGDGRADVDDLDDAALAAGRYLCADGHDLATAAGWTAAVLSYNHAMSYVVAVHDVAVRLVGGPT